MTVAVHNLIESSLQAAGSFAEPADRADLEDRLDLRLSLLEAIRRMDRRLQERAHAGEGPGPGAVEQVHRLYELWYASAAAALSELERAEERGEVIGNADEFRRACHSSHVPGLEPERLAAAAEQFRQGKGRPPGEVMNAVRNSARR